MSDLVDLLLDPLADPVVALHDETIQPDAVAQDLRERGLFAASIYLQAGDTDEFALRLLGQALRFPSYYGVNWDAADECLADMSWEPADGYVVLLLPTTLVGMPPDSIIHGVLELFRFAAASWREQGKPCKVVLFPPLQVV
jgi:hypothetical protein